MFKQGCLDNKYVEKSLVQVTYFKQNSKRDFEIKTSQVKYNLARSNHTTYTAIYSSVTEHNIFVIICNLMNFDSYRA